MRLSFFAAFLTLFCRCCSPAMATELTYVGKFNYPVITGTKHAFSSSWGPMAFRPSTGNLILRGHPINDPADVAEITIVAPGQTSKVAGEWFDLTRGIVAGMQAQTRMHGLDCTDDDYLMIGTNAWYQVSGVSLPTLILRDLKTGEAAGPWLTPYSSNANGGYVSAASPELAAHFGARWLSGHTIAQGSSLTNWGPSLYTLPQPGLTLAAKSTLPATPIITWPMASPMPGWHQTCNVNSVHDLETCTIWIGRDTSGAGHRWYDSPHWPVNSTTPNPDYLGTGKTRVNGKIYWDAALTPKGYHAANEVNADGTAAASAYKACAWILSHESIKAGRRDFQKIELPQIANPQSLVSGAVDRKGGRLFVLDVGKGIHVYGIKK